MLSRNIIDNSRSAKDTSRVIRMMIVSDTTTWSIIYDCHSYDSRGTIYDRNVVIIQATDHKYQYFDWSTKRASLLQQSKKLYSACPWHFLASFCFLSIKKVLITKLFQNFFFETSGIFFSLFISKIDPQTYIYIRLPSGLYCLHRLLTLPKWWHYMTWQKPNYTYWLSLLIGLYHPPIGVTNLKYKLSCLITPNKKISKWKALAFNRDRCCHLALCLGLIFIHWSSKLIADIFPPSTSWEKV
jgi:hypothetical protein